MQKIFKTDPIDNIQLRRNSGELIVQPQQTSKVTTSELLKTERRLAEIAKCPGLCIERLQTTLKPLIHGKYTILMHIHPHLMHLQRPKSHHFVMRKNLTGRKNLERPRSPKGRPKHYKTPWMDGQHGYNEFQTIFQLIMNRQTFNEPFMRETNTVFLVYLWHISAHTCSPVVF